MYGKEGLAEREKKHQLEKHEFDPEGIESKNLEQTVDTHTVLKSKVDVRPLETQLAQTRLHDKDAQSALDNIKSEEIREGIQTVETTREPVSIVTVPKAAVIQEHIHPVEKIEVQPVLHRDRQQMEVHQIVQPITEREVLPAVVQEKELAPQYIGDFVENTDYSKQQYVEGALKYESSVDVDNVRRIRVVKAPIVEETIHKTIIEEIQPVIHKETVAPVVIKETLPLYEKVVEAPTVLMEERSELDMGLKLPEDKNKIPLSEAVIKQLISHQEDPNLASVPVQEKKVI